MPYQCYELILPFFPPRFDVVSSIGHTALKFNLVDDADFGAMDVAGRYREFEDVALDFGEKAAVLYARAVAAYEGGGWFPPGSIAGATAGGRIDELRHTDV
jgi:hypothetical protein